MTDIFDIEAPVDDRPIRARILRHAKNGTLGSIDGHYQRQNRFLIALMIAEGYLQFARGRVRITDKALRDLELAATGEGG